MSADDVHSPQTALLPTTAAATAAAPLPPPVSSTTSVQHPMPPRILTDSLENPGYLPTPNTAVSETMTRASTIASEPMSRIATNEMICSPLDMLRIKSNVSTDLPVDFSTYGDQVTKDDVASLFPEPFPSENLFPQVNHTFNPELSVFPSSLSFDELFLSSSPVPNSLSQSNCGSISSSPLSKSRATRRTQDHIASASRPIAPRVKEEDPNSSSSARMVRVTSDDGKTKEVAQIPKTTYNRPAKHKTFCDKCNDQPEGFHGDHELRRHIERVHSTLRKVWVCKDISEDKKFLANCKACRNGKTYGANYNAAAHLRRTHFHPCKKGRGGRGKPNEKRGGKGGGDDPPMEELKHWMYQIEERVEPDGINHSLIDRTPQSESDLDDDNIFTKSELIDQAASFNEPAYYTLEPSYTTESYNPIDNIPRHTSVPHPQPIPPNYNTYQPQAESYLNQVPFDDFFHNDFVSNMDLQAAALA